LSLTAAQADPAEIERLLREAGVEREITPTGWMGYLEALLETLLHRLSGYGSPLRSFLEQHAGLSRWIAYGLLFVVLVLALIVVVEILRRRARGVVRAGEGVRVLSRPTPAARDAAAWRAAIERRLARGELGPALEALWWWFALSVAAEVPSSCTSRELVARSGRADLAAPARELDRLLYGPRRPRAEDVRAMALRLSPLLAPAPRPCTTLPEGECKQVS
jgi:hypothetical protein